MDQQVADNFERVIDKLNDDHEEAQNFGRQFPT
ncbi:hypothetical protein ABIE67_009131 [Streptomyces sp. V4I8]